MIGSNVFNILMILGVTGLVCPMEMEGISLVDFAMMMVSIMLMWLFSSTKLKVERWEGAWLVIMMVGYMGWLVWQASY